MYGVANMIKLTEQQFDASIRSLRNVAIISSMVGQARLTSYKRDGHVLGLKREYRGQVSYWRIA